MVEKSVTVTEIINFLRGLFFIGAPCTIHSRINLLSTSATHCVVFAIIAELLLDSLTH